MIDRLVRRLQKPTLSKLLANGKANVKYGDEIEQYQDKVRRKRPKSSKEQTKAMERVQKPTTASKRHIALNEGVVDKRFDDDVDDVLNTLYTDEERFLTKEEEKEIVSRVMAKTNAFRGGQPHCPKINSDEESLSLSQRKQYGLPLVSGLSRSQNVEEITTRVHSTANECAHPRRTVSVPQHRSPKHRTQPPVTTAMYVH